LNKEQSLELFSIFKNVKPKLDRSWMHLKGGKCQEMTQEEVSKAYHEGSESDRNKYYRELLKDFIGKSKQQPSTRSITVLFGEHGTLENFSLRLVYIKNARPQSKSGILRLYFSYYSYEDHELACDTVFLHLSKKMTYKTNSKRKAGILGPTEVLQVEKKVEVVDEEDEEWEKTKKEACERIDKIIEKTSKKFSANGLSLTKEYLDKKMKKFCEKHDQTNNNNNY